MFVIHLWQTLRQGIDVSVSEHSASIGVTRATRQLGWWTIDIHKKDLYLILKAIRSNMTVLGSVAFN